MTIGKTTLICTGGQEYEIDDKRILCNDVALPHDRGANYGNRLWIICNEFGAMGAVWARNEQDALDELVDKDLGAGILITDPTQEDYANEEYTGLGNAGEPCDLSNCRLSAVDFTNIPIATYARFAEARGSGADTLDDV